MTLSYPPVLEPSFRIEGDDITGKPLPLSLVHQRQGLPGKATTDLPSSLFSRNMAAIALQSKKSSHQKSKVYPVHGTAATNQRAKLFGSNSPDEKAWLLFSSHSVSSVSSLRLLFLLLLPTGLLPLIRFLTCADGSIEGHDVRLQHDTWHGRWTAVTGITTQLSWTNTKVIPVSKCYKHL